MNLMNMTRVFWILLLMLPGSLTGCKTPIKSSAKLKLIGGEEISEDRWPSVRKLKVFNKEPSGAFSLKSECTMTFIKPNLALTAAHCLCRGHRFVYAEKERWDDFLVTKHVLHPEYRCDTKYPNAFDVGLVWFDEKVAMTVSKIIRPESSENLSRLRMIGYGKDILKITGSFWLGTRKPTTESSKPSPRKRDAEFDGKRMGEVSWLGEQPEDPGFIRLSAVFDVTTEIREPMSEAASAEGDSGGPALTLENNEILGIISRGRFSFTGIGSEKVAVVTELIDLRRTDIRNFLKDQGALDKETTQ
jgi:hypothetical protein